MDGWVRSAQAAYDRLCDQSAQFDEAVEIEIDRMMKTDDCEDAICNIPDVIAAILESKGAKEQKYDSIVRQIRQAMRADAERTVERRGE